MQGRLQLSSRCPLPWLQTPTRPRNSLMNALQRFLRRCQWQMVRGVGVQR